MTKINASIKHELRYWKGVRNKTTSSDLRLKAIDIIQWLRKERLNPHIRGTQLNLEPFLTDAILGLSAPKKYTIPF